MFFNYLAEEDDRAGFRAAVRLTREIFSAAPLEPYRGAEIAPGPDVTTDDEIDAWVAETAETAYHPCGTCRMGADDMAVTAADGRVHGLEGVRVVDASLMPSATNGNLNAPTIMMAEKISDAVLGREPLPPSVAAYDAG